MWHDRNGLLIPCLAYMTTYKPSDSASTLKLSVRTPSNPTFPWHSAFQTLVQRAAAKNVIFGTLYGLGYREIAAQNNVDRDVVRSYVHSFRGEYPGACGYMETLQQLAISQVRANTPALGQICKKNRSCCASLVGCALLSVLERMQTCLR